MLQQTQVERVIPKYEAFVKKYPNAKALACANLSDVLHMWLGLGYNRRAKFLWQAAKLWGKADLEDLPGVGPYTANAVRVFAYNEPRTLIETNVRSVYLHYLFPNMKNVADAALLGHITVPRGVEPRVWYAALMDYGTHLKSKVPNPSRRSKHHITQKKFKGSDRELRGAIVRAYIKNDKTSLKRFSKKEVRRLTKILKREGLI